VSLGVCVGLCFLVSVVALHMGYRIGYQLGVEDGVTRAASAAFLDRQDHQAELLGAGDEGVDDEVVGKDDDGRGGRGP